MSNSLVFLSIPGLRAADLSRMPSLSALASSGSRATLVPSFPCVTWPVQTTMLTGRLPNEHGVVSNGFYSRKRHEVEMWTAGNEVIQSPQIWDLLHQRDKNIQSAVWFPMLSKRCGARYVCMPAPVHNPDGSESLWCYTKPAELYGELLGQLGHFPLQNFWGPMANIQSSEWIARSACLAAGRYHPQFFYIYIPHLDYAAQKEGPDSPAAAEAVGQLDALIGELTREMALAFNGDVSWMVASEYAIVPVNHVSYPNRILRELGLLEVRVSEGEQLDLERSRAWSLVDHQFSHLFVRDADTTVLQRIQSAFKSEPGIAEVLVGDQRSKYGMDHWRSGEVILISEPESWQAYYWWMKDENAPPYARTVDIHSKPGYDPVELCFDPVTKSIPLDATLVRGSHGAPAVESAQQGVVLTSWDEPALENSLRDKDIASIVMNRI